MNPQHDDHLKFDHLREELHELERRVDALEHRAESRLALQARITQPDIAMAVAGTDLELPNPSRAIPVAGRAVLGLAGAFLLRSLAESGKVPSVVVVSVALGYVVAWLVFSRRAREQNAFAGATYGITAALILMPLLWEATVRFHILAPPTTAAILFAFLALGSALSWSSKSEAVTTVITFATLLTTFVLMIQTGDLVPFVSILLATGCGFEALEGSGHPQKMRVPVAFAADLGFWLILYTMTRPTGVPENYKSVPLVVSLMFGGLLFAIYAAGIVWQIAVRRRVVSGFEIAQTLVAFAVATGGALQLTQGRAAILVGVLCAIACAACYIGAFVWFAEAPGRVHHMFAAWAVALGLAACFLMFHESRLPLIWGAMAVVATAIGTRVPRTALVVHGGLYLIAAGLTCGLPMAISNAFTATRLEAASVALWITAIAAVCCYAACFYFKLGRTPAVLRLVPGLVATISAGALLVLVIVPVVSRNPTPPTLATARTLVVCSIALAIGFTASRTGHRELVWISYLTIGLGGVKLILEDLRASQAGTLAISFVCYGAVLVLVPRLIAKSLSTNRQDRTSSS
jgi:hypothetical protein